MIVYTHACAYRESVSTVGPGVMVEGGGLVARGEGGSVRAMVHTRRSM